MPFPLRYFALFLLTLAACVLAAQKPYVADLSFMTPAEEARVLRVLDNMTLDQQIGQLIMLRAHSNLGADHVAHVKREIEQYHVGGLCFFQGTPSGQLALTNDYQDLSEVPLMVSMDAEWGLAMRLPDQTIGFPKQLALGAIRDNTLLYEMGSEIARQLHRLGVHVSFSPVLDVNNNPDNPVINTRSFGEDRYNVTVKGYQYMRGLQENGILASAKHFPGHGDTGVDSHYDLPVISHDRARLDSLELYPFQALVRYGIGSIMAAHLQIPALDDRPNRPSSLSRPIVYDLLRREMGFTGLVFTDGLEMQGVTKHYGNGEVEAEAIAAGSDILLLPESTPDAVNAIKRYIREGKITEAQIREKARRVLLSKDRLGILESVPRPSTANLLADLNTQAAEDLKLELYQAAMTLVRDTEELVPLAKPANGRLTVVHVGEAAPNNLSRTLDKSLTINHVNVSTGVSAAERAKVLNNVKAGDRVVVALYSDGSRFLEKVPIGSGVLSLLRAVDERAELVVTVLGNPYSLKSLDAFGTVLQAYSRDRVAQTAAARALVGTQRIDGRLPVTASAGSAFNAGTERSPIMRMGSASPEAMGIDGRKLTASIDALAGEAMRKKATPGMVALVAKGGNVVFEKAYGYHTYNRRRKTKTSDVFDLASVTKVAATTVSLMKLVDEGKVNLDTPISNYLPETQGTAVEFLTLRPMLAHRSGLRSWIPFYKRTLDYNGRPKRDWYRTQAEGDYVIPVTDRMFMKTEYLDSMWLQLYTNELPNKGQYRYSDLGLYLAAKIIDRVSGLTVDEYAARNFYRPMGLETLTFNPLRKFAKDRIPPTEKDTYFRMSTIQGNVHDMGAAMLGGVSGHAGLFGSARDLATLFQMLLQNGNYGGVQYIKPETVRLFTTRYAGETRRALGFDMKQLNPDLNLNLAPEASDRAFGHLGFTGICVWADPAEDLIVVVLANRTYPKMSNNTFGKLDTRLRVHSAAYRAFLERAR